MSIRIYAAAALCGIAAQPALAATAYYTVAGGAQLQGVARLNPKILQVRTNVDFSAPAAKLGAAVLRAGGRTGPPNATFPGPNYGDSIRYHKTAAQFGGPLQRTSLPRRRSGCSSTSAGCCPASTPSLAAST